MESLSMTVLLSALALVYDALGALPKELEKVWYE